MQVERGFLVLSPAAGETRRGRQMYRRHQRRTHLHCAARRVQNFSKRQQARVRCRSACRSNAEAAQEARWKACLLNQMSTEAVEACRSLCHRRHHHMCCQSCGDGKPASHTRHPTLTSMMASPASSSRSWAALLCRGPAPLTLLLVAFDDAPAAGDAPLHPVRVRMHAALPQILLRLGCLVAVTCAVEVPLCRYAEACSCAAVC